MHVHGSATQFTINSLETANAAQRASGTQQAADVRKQLSMPSIQAGEDADFDPLLLGHAHDRAQQRNYSSADDANEEQNSRNPDESSGGVQHWSSWA